MWARIEQDRIRVYRAPTAVVGPDGTRHGPDIFRKWTDPELAEIGILRVVRDQTPTPPYHVRNTPTYASVDGQIVETVTFGALSVDQVCAARKAEVKQEFLRRFNEGFVFDDSVPVDINADSQQNIDTEYSAAMDTVNFPEWDTEYVWRGWDDQFYPMDRGRVVQMALAARDHKRALLAAKWQHEGVLANLDELEDFVDFDPLAGWPQSAREWTEEQEEQE